MKRTFQPFCAAISPNAIARCVLPVPLGPSRTIFSARSTKPNDASSWIWLRGAPVANVKS